jgi:hypothetical protein
MSTPASEQIGSAAHLVAVNLESAGQILQSRLLDSISADGASLGASIATLIFVITATTSIFSWAVLGNRSIGMWLLIGPSLFWMAVSFRVPSVGPSWNFGERTYSAENALKNTKAVIAPAGEMNSGDKKQMKVSWLFAQYDEIVSNILQSLIYIVDKISPKSDLTFFRTTEKYYEMLNQSIANAELKQFLHEGLIKRCSSYYALQKQFSENIDNVRKDRIKAQLEVQASAATFRTSESSAQLQAYLLPLINDYLKDNKSTNSDIQNINGDYTLNCKGIWNLTVFGTLRESTNIITQISSKNLPEGITAEEVRKRIESKMETTIKHPDGKLIEKLSDDQKFLVLINEVAARMILSEFKNVAPTLISFPKEDISIPLIHRESVPPATGLAEHLRTSSRIYENEAKTTYMTLALSMPYVQGIALYLLAMFFPIACFTLLIPSKFKGLLLWMGLWLWIKSWDLGFAFVYILDKFLYNLLPSPMPISGKLLENPVDVIKTVLEVDPTYSAYTYYNILASAMMAVPVITGFLIRRGAGEFLDHVSQTAGGLANKFSTPAVAFHESLFTSTMYEKNARDIYGAAQRSLGNADSNPEVRDSYAKAIDAKVGGILAEASSPLYQAATKVPLLGNAAMQRNAILVAGAKAEATRQTRIMGAAIKLNAQIASWNEAFSEHAMRRAPQAVAFRMSQHDHLFAFPANAISALRAARATIPLASQMNSILKAQAAVPKQIQEAYGMSPAVWPFQRAQLARVDRDQRALIASQNEQTEKDLKKYEEERLNQVGIRQTSHEIRESLVNLSKDQEKIPESEERFKQELDHDQRLNEEERRKKYEEERAKNIEIKRRKEEQKQELVAKIKSYEKKRNEEKKGAKEQRRRELNAVREQKGLQLLTEAQHEELELKDAKEQRRRELNAAREQNGLLPLSETEFERQDQAGQQ